MSADLRTVPPRLSLRQVEVAGGAPLDLTVHAGQLIGVSGWTSSAVFWAVAGLARPDRGQVSVDGYRIGDQEQALAAGVHLIPPGNALASLLTAYENVFLPLGQGRVDTVADPEAVARQALAAVGLADSADHLVEELSGGQQQRVAVARALASRPRVLLADQATTDLDPATRSRVVQLFRELAADGAAVLVASDDPTVTAGCDRVVDLGSERS